MNNLSLEKCSYCGADPFDKVHHAGFWSHIVSCPKCGNMVEAHGYCPSEARINAFKMWNSRKELERVNQSYNI